ncbi:MULTISPECIES: crotonase/enoyl-CoA hydratase family protein [unclassified Mesorhizobium]|uniref:crotonase/enoyl-CoA hydratase family protein n=3 Tax=Mesorhizobium TaxID=68287 RepID=UPI000FCCDD99|nr:MULTISPECIES: crotonase/enoyl-CoA hydratase family protein [unclassified Mesorhizobium]RUV43833.1 crotonase/enoyl-CoA hydratase family protein [Mesorhizobium sp. M1A.T.Ca.IN.004.03.1.1]RWI88554.1 MAG: crotonase/enoyl-CoA hydratase family protein [Mesorhizobium sp.]RWK32547.1 MAG: crotonase/enoyl-CoA hydratase family protein [Mesorhizobium sp.]RWK85671.1 MAG: crotonase/enoyl-CoA hydratase family protein [Mesorhizobium sp.]TIP16155.1 MAG: crotonase/enoyl-CoA hydratase family protein [Mesorhiz
MTEPVLCEIRDRVAVLTLNRPEKLNALNYDLIDRLLAILDRIETDDAVRAVILTGAGERAFSAGGDIHEFALSVAEGTDVALRDFVMRGQRLTARLEAFRKPVIAAVNGLAFGGGCETIEAVPLAVASDRALFAKPEIKLAMPPTFGGTQRLPRLAGRKRALELLLTGEPFSPARALELGLVNKVVAHEELMPAALDLANRIIRHSQAAVAGILTAVARGINLSIAEGLLVEAEQFARMAPTADLGEGLSAWIERRQPIYDGSWTHVTRLSEARRASFRRDPAAD